MTDNTQELDEILKKGYRYEGHEFVIDTPYLKQAILDWHNKQVLAELGDSLHNDNLDEAAYSDIEHRYDKYFDKLKESKSDAK